MPSSRQTEKTDQSNNQPRRRQARRRSESSLDNKQVAGDDAPEAGASPTKSPTDTSDTSDRVTATASAFFPTSDMPHYWNGHDPFIAAEDRLPPGQPPILTSSVERLHAYLRFQAQTRQVTGYSSLGIVTGDAGIGKTIAIQAFLDGQRQTQLQGEFTFRSKRTKRNGDEPGNSYYARSSSTGYLGYGGCARIKIAPRATAKSVATDLIHCVDDRSIAPGSNIYALEDASVAVIRRQSLSLLIVDEGDWLTVDSFEVLRHVFDRTGCPIVIVGLPHILQVVRRHEKFLSRVGLWMEFLPLSQEEVVEQVLPQLRIPRWSYDPQVAQDHALGVLLWSRIQPSLRKLRVVLQYASQLAVAANAPKITQRHLDEIFHATLLPQNDH